MSDFFIRNNFVKPLMLSLTLSVRVFIRVFIRDGLSINSGGTGKNRSI
jgi:hypothetical protein